MVLIQQTFDIAPNEGVAQDTLPHPANTDQPMPALTSSQKIVAWLFRFTPRSSNPTGTTSFEQGLQITAEPAIPHDDWQTVTILCAHTAQDFAAAKAALPLTAAEIDHFRRNHRDTDNLVGRDFLAAKSDLPSPLAELYGLYRHRARMDAESALFVAQATGSTRVARLMADLLAIGGFAGGVEYIPHMAKTYSIPAAFDTSDLIDRANQEATRRLALSIEPPAHLLKLSPDEISVLASNIVENSLLSAPAFLEKANLLAEARQDVNRLPTAEHFATAINEGDLCASKPWLARLCTAYANIFKTWTSNAPQIDAIVQKKAETAPI